MATAFEIALAAAVGVVLVSLAGILARRLSERALVLTAFALTALAAAASVGLLVALARDSDDERRLAVTAAGLVLAAAAQAGLVWLRRGLFRVSQIEAATGEATAQLESSLAAHRRLRATELEQSLTRERAEARHLLVEQERALAKERREAVAAQAEQANQELADRLTMRQRHHEQRLGAWSDDLERSQEEIKGRLEQTIAEQDGALERLLQAASARTAELEAFAADQRTSIERLRADFSQLVADTFESGESEIEAHEQQLRHHTTALAERLRELSTSIREHADREEVDTQARISQESTEIERRVTERLQRLLDRAVDRLMEEAERRFDTQIRTSRDETARRLSRELERTTENLAITVEKEIENRMSEVAQLTAVRLQRELDDVVRQAEAQTGVAEERIAFLTDRLEKALEAAAGRLASFETDLELELSSKLAEFDRAVRHAQHTVEHETK